MQHSQSILCKIVVIGFAVMLPFGGAHATRVEVVLHSFGGGRDGAYPFSGLIMDGSGNLYGTTREYGDIANCHHQCGTVFSVTPNGHEHTIYTFNGNDGASPQGSLYKDSSGNLYGATAYGGGRCQCGVVFKVATDGTETVLHRFSGGVDGVFPLSGIIGDERGNLFGTTEHGGRANFGIVFRIAPDGTEKVLHTFLGGSDGATPDAGLIRDKRGNLYGTAVGGGTLGYGVIFTFTPHGKETVLHDFDGNDGFDPSAVIMDKAGYLYGTNYYGGALGQGDAYSLAQDGTYSVLHSFSGGSDGGAPSGLIVDPHGNLYGTINFGGGGSCGCGAVFRISPDETETVLYRFQGGNDGQFPVWNLIEDASGNLYGTTPTGGGINDLGTVFVVKK
jgi:uncharacterized repeat protein (TIGR03803 family)